MPIGCQASDNQCKRMYIDGGGGQFLHAAQYKFPWDWWETKIIILKFIHTLICEVNSTLLRDRVSELNLLES